MYVRSFDKKSCFFMTIMDKFFPLSLFFRHCTMVNRNARLAEGGVDLVAKIVVVYGPREGMVRDRHRR